MGIMQAELQEKRQWVTKERFVEGLSLVNMLPGATAAQLSIFLGYAPGGWWGGLLAGLCFVVPGFLVLLVLAVGYAAFGATPLLRGALYGLGPVMLGIYVVAIYRLGRIMTCVVETSCSSACTDRLRASSPPSTSTVSPPPAVSTRGRPRPGQSPTTRSRRTSPGAWRATGSTSPAGGRIARRRMRSRAPWPSSRSAATSARWLRARPASSAGTTSRRGERTSVG